jgi:lipoprotein-anchoring transpeptidase ErfK/SrfK
MGAAPAACVVLLALAAPSASAARPQVARNQPLVAVFAAHSVRERPSTTSATVSVLRSTRPITRERTTLPVLARRVGPRGRTWLRVRLPGRVLTGRTPPRTGWIRTTRTLPSSTPWHIVVERSVRRVTVYRAGRPVRSFPAIVGKPATPTPPGQFFVEENVRLSGAQPGAPFALATSARSTVLQEFDGGPGQIALHGLGGVGGRLGTAVSHGCVRLGGGAITWLAARTTPGVPITIV